MAVLSELKMYGKHFILEVGDKFRKTVNGDFYYYPVGAKNKALLPNSSGFYLSKSIAVTKKYHYEILESENIITKSIYQGIMQHEVEWVEEVKVEKPNLGELYFVGVYSDRNMEKHGLFRINKSIIIKKTPRTIYVDSQLVGYKQFNIDQVNSIVSKAIYGSNILPYNCEFGAICTMDKFDEIRDQLVQRVKQRYKMKVLSAQAALRILEKELEKNGY